MAPCLDANRAGGGGVGKGPLHCQHGAAKLPGGFEKGACRVERSLHFAHADAGCGEVRLWACRRRSKGDARKERSDRALTNRGQRPRTGHRSQLRWMHGTRSRKRRLARWLRSSCSSFGSVATRPGSSTWPRVGLTLAFLPIRYLLLCQYTDGRPGRSATPIGHLTGKGKGSAESALHRDSVHAVLNRAGLSRAQGHVGN